MTKTYPFSIKKHGHDIEYYYNHLSNRLDDADNGEIQMSTEEYNKLYDFLYGDLEELYNLMFNNDSVVWLTGKQFGLAKKIVAWSHEKRVGTCIQNERFEDMQYC